MAKIPKAVLDRSPVLSGPLIGQGKVRDTYDLGHFSKFGGGKLMFVVASDRCSIFDFVLNTLVPQKGEVLTALNYFWVAKVIRDLCETDMVACGAGIDEFLPSYLRGNLDLQKRSTVVRLLPAPEVEDIVRLVLTGSGLKSYNETGMICGHKLPAGLTDGSLLPYPIYTPTTKAVEGHDLHITADSVVEKYGFKRERLAIQVASVIANYAAAHGIRLADTKFEFSGNILADEKGTPDSSRFVDEKAWQKAMKAGKFPASLDKQYVREWGKKLGIDKRDPENPEDVAWVHSQEVPADVVEMTTKIYRYIFWRLTGMKLERFQREEMGIDVVDRRPTVDIVVGSSSDIPQLHRGLDWLSGRARFRVSVMSCHRNQKELIDFANNELIKSDAVVACAGKAAQLPADIKVKLCLAGHPEVPVLGVALKGATIEDDRDAIGSIQGLPGQPVELDESGHAYFGDYGVLAACKAATENEFLPKPMESKPAEIGKWYEVPS
ncbi:MAG: phosphoribosylaminoimidazolesuccinocarboxamide synthase [bacterium]